jgi:hypothetical protein
MRLQEAPRGWSRAAARFHAARAAGAKEMLRGRQLRKRAKFAILSCSDPLRFRAASIFLSTAAAQLLNQNVTRV